MINENRLFSTPVSAQEAAALKSMDEKALETEFSKYQGSSEGAVTMD